MMEHTPQMTAQGGLAFAVAVVDVGKGEKILSLFREEHALLDYVCMAHGTARTEMLDLIERTVMPYGTLSALQAQGDRVDVELNETDLDRIAEALSAVKASSIVESVGLELAETEKDRPADVMKCTLHIVLRGEAAE